MKEQLTKLLNPLNSIRRKYELSRFNEEIKQKVPIITHLYDLAEEFGEEDSSIRTDHAFDILRSYKSLILTKHERKMDKSYRITLSKGKNNTHYLKISDMTAKEGTGRSMLINEIYDQAYSILDTKKYENPNKEVTFSLQEQIKFLEEVYQAPINMELTKRTIGRYSIAPFAPSKNRN